MSVRFGAFFFVLLGILTTPLSVYGEDDLRLLGVGALMSTSPYVGVGTRTTVIPILVGDYKNFYVKGAEAGYHFVKNNSLTLSVMGSPRFMGYNSSDSDDLAGMQDRRMSADGGFRADFNLPFSKELTLSASAVTDISSTHDGQEYELSLAKKFKARYFQFTPACGVRFQSARMVDYYYGVESSEVRSGRPEYEPGGTVNYYGQAVLNFGIAKDWIVVTRAGIEFLGSDVKKSPIVDEDHLLTAVIGITRRF